MTLLKRILLATLMVFFWSATISLASAEQDPPSRAARLQFVSGSVSVQPNGVDEWVAGEVNRPLTNADNIWADKNSRAELNVGTGIIRINSETSLTLTNIGDNAAQIELHQGAMNLYVRHLYDGEIYELDTPNQAFTILKSGEYRFDVDPYGDATVVTVWKGEGEATGQGEAVRVHAHQRARFTGGNSLQHVVSAAPNQDGFDEWCRVRNRRNDESVSARYVSPDVVGSEDLDAYGTWRTVPEYGSVWVPTVVRSDWAPYRYGHWIWVEPWGWTWMDDASWGYAPFHYGRWVYTGGYWGWAPGPYYGGGWGRAWYAPALVTWFGGDNWGVGIGFGGGYGRGFGGGLGWCALGFGEPFYPSYGGSRGYFRNVNITNTNITNITNITNNYYNNKTNPPPTKPPKGGGGGPYGPHSTALANMHAPGGFTAVQKKTLENSLPVNRNTLQVSPQQARNAPVLTRVNATPTRESVLGRAAGNNTRQASVPPAQAASRPVVSRMTPPATPSRGPNIAGMTRTPEGAGARGVQGNQPNRVSIAGGDRGVTATTNPRAQTSQATGGANNAPVPMHAVPRPPSAGGARGVMQADSRPAGVNQGIGGENGRSASSPNSRPNSGPTNSRTQTTAPSAGNRSVPRPPQVSENGRMAPSAANDRTTAPPASTSTRGNPSMGKPSPSIQHSDPNTGIRSQDRSAPLSGPRSVPRPPEGSSVTRPSGNSPYSQSGSYGNSSTGRYSAPSRSPYEENSSRGSSSNAPYAAPRDGVPRGNSSYGHPSYGNSSRGMPSSGNAPYSAPRTGGSYSGGGGSYGGGSQASRGSYSGGAPSGGGGGYSAHSAPSASHSSAPSGGGGSHGSSSSRGRH
jgi:hypothetical protein